MGFLDPMGSTSKHLGVALIANREHRKTIKRLREEVAALKMKLAVQAMEYNNET
jgi:hypothetical protein